MATCTITGTIQTLAGVAVPETQVRFRIKSTESDQSGQVASGVGVISDEVVDFTDDNGLFSMDLTQGAVAELEIPAINLRKTITIPSSAGPVDFVTLI